LYSMTMTNTVFNHCVFEFGSTLITLNSGASATVTNSVFRNASQYGIWVDCGATLTESGNTFQNCASGDIYNCE
jgi:hypothetical protein